MKLVKRQRSKIIRKVGWPRARRFTVKMDPTHPHVMEVFIAQNRAHMHAEIMRRENVTMSYIDVRCRGMVRHYFSKTDGRFVVRKGHIAARMFLNQADLRANPNEIVSHECAHAGMAWARLRKANLKKMDGEEVMAHATGRLCDRVIGIGHSMKVWG